MSSIQSSRQGTPQMRANSHYRRGVDFSSVRKRPEGRRRQNIQDGGRTSASLLNNGATHRRPTPSQSPRDISARDDKSSRLQEPMAKPKDGALLWNEELRHFSSSIAKDCDEAFRGSLLTMDSLDRDGEAAAAQDSFFSLSLGTPKASTAVSTPTSQTGPRPWDSRPLPPTPPRSESVQLEVMQAQAGREQQPGYSGPCVTPVPNRIEKVPQHLRPLDVNDQATVSSGERRTVSAPVYAQYSRNARPLPSIYEASPENWQRTEVEKQRTVSAPAKSPAGLPTPYENKGLNFLSQAGNTIRVVHSPGTAHSDFPVATPLPLKLTKKPPASAPGLRHGPTQPPAGLDLRRQYALGGQQSTSSEHAQTPSQDSHCFTAGPKKKRSWFRRSSKSDVQNISMQTAYSHESKGSASTQPCRTESQSTTEPPPVPAEKKKGFIFPFWKSSKSDPKLSLAGRSSMRQQCTASMSCWQHTVSRKLTA